MPRRVLTRTLGEYDPRQVFLTLFADDPYAFWLDSGVDAVRGVSYLGGGLSDSRVVEAAVDGTVSVRNTSGGPSRVVGDDLLVSLCSELAAHDVESVPDGFGGGWVGWFGYEFGARRNGVAVGETRVGAPGAQLLFADRVLAYDHATGLLEARVLDGVDAAGWLESVRSRLRAASVPPSVVHAVPSAGSVTWRHSDEEYRELVRRCQLAIRAGDAYQLCLTTQAQLAVDIDPVAAYLQLRSASPSHHGGLLRFGDFSLLSASPERFLRVTTDGIASSSPIKGTRPRGADIAGDAALARELAASEKERAENLMITDLVRNDLARVAQTGSVVVTALNAVETYPQVHQLVSTVRARLAAGNDGLDAFDACFPAGSMTGAPKHSAMGILHDLEAAARGAYAGAFGYLGVDGAIDLAMTIRTIVLERGRATIGTGGGITALSDPQAELDEAKLKAAVLLQVLGVSAA